MKLRWRMLPLALAVAILFSGMGLFFVRLWRNGESWAMNPWNDTIYRDGVLTVGTITDRNGEVLTFADGNERFWSEDPVTRLATLHAVGDPLGNIGTGALTAFPGILAGYTFLSGVWSEDGFGGTLTLSIDAGLCRTALEALDGRSGAVLVCNYRTGEILCMVSAPGYDPADSETEIPDGAYLNRCLSGTYPPGSVFKIVTAAAALETVPGILDRTFFCEGSVEIGGGTVACAGVHGEVTLEDAFAASCNCAFAQIAQEVGGETLITYASSYGLTEPLYLDGVETGAGSMDETRSGSVELSWAGIGQHTDLVCPIGILRLCCAVAGDGEAVDLTMLLNGNPEHTSTCVIERNTAIALDSMMTLAVYSTYGNSNFPGLELRAKSGTAEIDGSDSHAWFCGYLADPETPYAFTVLVEHGGSGALTAGSVANTVLQAVVSSGRMMSE